jgi:Family of unknown function (DUF6519)
MRGDFSRLRFDRTKHYTSVLEQQGRLALDADRNEQCVIDEYIRAIETIDVIGPFGGPKDNAGFAITIAGNTIEIGAGRYYVDGILCENEGQLGYGEQPFLIHPASADSELLTELSSGTIDSIRLFFEVWHRIVTALDDACLREPALGQTDTTARVQTVWRVVAERTLVRKPIPIPMPTRIPLNPVLLDRAATLSIIAKPLASATLATAATPTGTVAPGAASDASARAAASLSCCEQMYVPLTQPAAGKLSAQTTGGAADCSCQPTPAAGYRGLENQLYRVEIHRSGSESTATFKWSRENGSVVAGVISISGADVVVDSIGPDANLGFQPGQWVELSDDSYLFGPVPNQPGELFQIKSVSPEHRTITMTGSVSQIDPSRNARLRRWEQFGTSATVNGVALATGSWLDLENGIQVRFAAGDFESGDYWLIPARTGMGQIEWPPCGSDGAAFQPPIRTHVYRAPLACIHWDAKAQKTIIEDCRRFFPPLTEVSANAVSTAIHVTKINWANDDLMTFDDLIQNGLVVSIDQTVTGRVDSGNFSVVLEIPMQSKLEPAAVVDKLTPIVFRTEMSLDGIVTIQPSAISWAFPFDPSKAASFRHVGTLGVINTLLLQGLDYSTFARARVRLLGETIFSGSGTNQIFLDGESFGIAGTRADGVTPRTDLQFPSGSPARASDFESWFYLAPILQLASLTVAPSAVTITPTAPTPLPQATLTVNYPPISDTVVDLSVTPPAGFEPAVTVPASVTVPKGKNSVQFGVGVTNTGSGSVANYQIVATLASKIRLPSTQIANLAVTGIVIIG